MTTSSSQLREIAHDVIQAASPGLVRVGEIYAAVEQRVSFDDDDLRPPTLHDESVNEPSWKRNVRNALQRERHRLNLVCKKHDGWTLPTPLPTDAELDVEAGWRNVRLAALRESVSQSTWKSPVQGQRYQVQEVAPHALLIRRVDSDKPASVQASFISRSLQYLNAAGGIVGRRTLHQTVAIETAIVHLHPRIHWSDDSNWIEVSGTQSQESGFGEDAADAEAAYEATGEEGARKLVTHWQRERNSALVRKFKDEYVNRNAGTAPCEVCGFDLRTRFPGLEAPYVEAHHRDPLSELTDDAPRELKYENLAFLCANCHRAIHRPFDGTFLSVDQLKGKIDASDVPGERAS